MSDDVFALIAGTLLAVGALAWVLHPLFFPVDERAPVAGDTDAAASADSAIVALREIEFDRATGKLSDSDYAELKRAYTERALQEMRAQGDAAAAADALDAIEARVRAFRRTHRECVTCGVRPEPDAVYCSTCGGYLARACPNCGAAISESAATFCSSCGFVLRASAGASRSAAV